MAKRKTHAEYVAQVQDIHEGRIEVLEPYVNKSTKILHRCTIDGHEWEARPNCIIPQRRGCPACSARKSSESAGKRRATRADEAEKQRARDMRAEGMTIKQIAQTLNRSPYAINSWCNPSILERARLKTAEWTQKNRQRHLDNNRRYRSEFTHGRASNAKHSAQYRAWKLEWFTHCPDDIAAMQAIYVECERITRETGVEHEVDHIWPLSLGGPHLPWNLQVITKEENRRKNASFSEADHARYVQAINDLFNNH